MKKLPFLLPLLLCAIPLAAQQTTISGKLLGHDGKPIPTAHVHLTPSNNWAPIVSVPVAADGSYRLETTMRGYYALVFTGVNHQMSSMPVLLDKPATLAIDARLGTYASYGVTDSVKVIGAFNDYDFSSGVPMRKGKNGTYTATFTSKEKTFPYQLVFSMPEDGTLRSMNGTQADSYEYDGGGDYRSAVAVKNGKVTITFDPKKLAPAAREGKLTYTDRVTTRLKEITDHIRERRNKMVAEIRGRMSRGEDLSNFSYDWSAEATSLAGEIARETDPTVRKLLLLSYGELSNQGARDLDTALLRRALGEIEPTSPVWGTNPASLSPLLRVAANQADAEKYRLELVRSHPDTVVRKDVLYRAALEIKHEEEPEKFLTYYKMLMNDFGNSYEAKYAKAEVDPDRAIQLGRTIPGFSVASLDNSETISSETMKGKVYLIDFWATWCGPCVGEMGSLHAAYEKFQNRNFEIVSLSFDGKPEDVARFRKGKWKMPWKHTFVKGGFNSELARQFEVLGIPKPILVDGDGKIIATENDLRGTALERTLARVLGETELGAR